MSDAAFYRELVDRLRSDGFEVEEKTGTHYRVNKRLDLYPVTRRFHDIERNERGDYDDLVGFVKLFFKNVSCETSKSNDPSWTKTSAVGVVIGPKSFRRAGRTIDAWREFFSRGKNGEALIYATPEGSFYSPRSNKLAIAEAVSKAQDEWNQTRPSRPELPAEDVRRNAIRDCIEIVHECLTWSSEISSDSEEARRELKRAILERFGQLK